MTTSLTIRTDPALKEALSRRAEAKGVTTSELAREILSEALAERPLGQKVGHLRGTLDESAPRVDAWRKALRARNWRP
jgi:plasmid stability protein